MKNTLKTFGIITLAVVMGFAMMACGETETSDPTSATYTSYDADGNTYKLVVTKDPNRAAYTPQDGDTFVLTITSPDGTLVGKSTGTVKTVSGTTFTLEKDSETFTVTVSGTTIETIPDPIPLDNGEPLQSPTLTPNKPNDNGGKPITVTGAQIYKWDNGELVQYPGTGTVQNITGRLDSPPIPEEETKFTEIGTIGSISADGKLTMTLPGTVSDDKLFVIPQVYGGDGKGKYGALHIVLSLVNNDQEYPYLYINYYNQDFNVNGTLVKKGWNYINATSSSSGIVVTDISGYKWVLTGD